jgi:hypothetical protein
MKCRFAARTDSEIVGMRGSRRRVTGSWVALVGSLVVIASAVLSLSGASEQPSEGPLLDCDQIAEETSEYGDGTIAADTPELLLQRTEYLEFLGLSEQARVLVKGDPTPEFGLVEVAPDADGVVTTAEANGEATSFLAFESSKRVAQLFIGRTPDGKYWVAGAASC